MAVAGIDNQRQHDVNHWEAYQHEPQCLLRRIVRFAIDDDDGCIDFVDGQYKQRQECGNRGDEASKHGTNCIHAIKR